MDTIGLKQDWSNFKNEIICEIERENNPYLHISVLWQEAEKEAQTEI